MVLGELALENGWDMLQTRGQLFVFWLAGPSAYGAALTEWGTMLIGKEMLVRCLLKGIQLSSP
jgi:hypothetical protein